jgi:CO/xanthine dehydrogenase FAD-binding subunit
MIKNFLRPKTIEEAISLLNNENTFALYGLTSGLFDSVNGTLIDLQDCGLGSIQVSSGILEVGSCVSLQSLLESDLCPLGLRPVIEQEQRLNLRNMYSVFEAIATANGRSVFTTALLALDAKIKIYGQKHLENLGDYLPLKPKGLVEAIYFSTESKFAFESVARTPNDVPVVCAALTRWSADRYRLAVGGFGKLPLLVVDGRGSNGIELAAKNVYINASDPKATGQYRSEMAKVLTERCLEKLQ